MQFAALSKPSVGILFDSDMGNNIDAALALALLYGFDGKDEARVVSLSSSNTNLDAAAYCDAVARFYAGPSSGAFGFFGRSLPVGLATEGKMSGDAPMLAQPLGKRKEDGTPVYPHSIHKLTDTADPIAVIRNALTAQHDENAIVVVAGPVSNMVRALALPGVKDLAARKVRYLSLAAGCYPQGPPDARIKADVSSARKFFEEWPTPIVAAGTSLGEAILFPAASIEKDFAWTPAHPVVDAYRAYKPMPYNAQTTALSAVLYAVRPKEGYFKLSEPGTIGVLDDGRTTFTPSESGKHRYLVSIPDQKERILKVWTELASAKPVPKQRFRPPVKAADKEEKKENPPKP